MLFKVYTSVDRQVPMNNGAGYDYMEEQTAHGECVHFTSKEKALAFVQQYSTTPVKWGEYNSIDIQQDNGDVAKFFLREEADLVLDPQTKPALPTTFRAPYRSHD